ncbi:hypothetical protein ACFLXE_00195 [Chloroflexota bacterium]
MQYRETFTEQPVREKRVLAYATGAEHKDSVVLESSLGTSFSYTESMTGHTVSGKKYVSGQLIAKIANTNHGGKVGRYGPYTPAATDGRGDTAGVAPSSLRVLIKDQVATFGDVPAAAYVDFCVFDEAQLVSYSGNENKVKAAMPRCRFTTISRLD